MDVHRHHLLLQIMYQRIRRLRAVGLIALFLCIFAYFTMCSDRNTGTRWSLFRSCFSSATASGETSSLEDNVRTALRSLYDQVPCNPIMVRLAWHDAGTYDKATKTGGPNGSVRFQEETVHAANAGLPWAVEKMEEIKAKFPDISYADLYQLASVVAIEHAGGPRIPFRLGRKDVPREQCVEEGRLPDGNKGVSHLHDIFYRMGFTDQEIVALSGAHTLGRAHKERSGFEGAWTEQPLRFDNSYFKNILNPVDSLLLLPTDKALLDSPDMIKYVTIYAEDQDRFFNDYVAAHQKLSELGVSF
eukprot:m.120540 g.120540  ORF g.120540 m.120540 type:complete len:302 (+) comp15497_c0_seq4:465-1370(+)